jgi:hypothetical protein
MLYLRLRRGEVFVARDAEAVIRARNVHEPATGVELHKQLRRRIRHDRIRITMDDK